MNDNIFLRENLKRAKSIRKNQIRVKAENYARDLRLNATEPEKLLCEILMENRIWFEFQKPIIKGERFHIVDFAFKAVNGSVFALELNGPQHYTDEGRSKDRSRETFLLNRGFTRIIQIRNRTLYTNLRKVMRIIYSENPMRG